MKTSRELGLKLKKAGAKQQGRPSDEKRGCSVFDCHELLEGLPKSINEADLQLSWYFDHWCAGYHVFKLKGGKKSELFLDYIPAEALGKLYLWCLQNGHCNE